MESKRPLTRTLLPPLALAALTIAVYLNALTNGFAYDDNENILANPWITDFSRIPDMFTRSSMEFLGLSANTYRPILHLAFNIEYHLFGTNPLGYHTVAVLLHTMNALAVFFVAGALLRDPDKRRKEASWAGPFFAGAVFALHPINTESVAWVSAIPEVVFTLFVLMAFYVHVKDEGAGFIAPVLSAAFYFIALLAKETAIVFLPLIIAYDLVYKGSVVKRWKAYLACLAAALIYMALRTSAVGGIVHEHTVSLSLFERVINIFPLFMNYMKKLTLPFEQNALYVFKPVVSPDAPVFLFSAVFTIGYFAAAFFLRRKKAFCFAMLWAALPLAPVLFFIPVLSKASFAERYLYLSSAGFGVGLCVCLDYLLNKMLRFRRLAIAAVVALLMAYSVATVKRNLVWESDMTLWADVIAKSPGNVYGHFELANAYLGSGDKNSALAHYRKVLEIDPGVPQAHYNIGIVYMRDSLLEEAASEFRSALRLNPGYKDARLMLDEVEELLNRAGAL